MTNSPQTDALEYVNDKFANGESFINRFKGIDDASMSYCAGYYLALCHNILGGCLSRDSQLEYAPIRSAFHLGWDDAIADQENGNVIFGAE